MPGSFPGGAMPMPGGGGGGIPMDLNQLAALRDQIPSLDDQRRNVAIQWAIQSFATTAREDTAPPTDSELIARTQAIYVFLCGPVQDAPAPDALSGPAAPPPTPFT